MALLASSKAGPAPVTCPLLGEDGACTVYEAVGDTPVIWGNGEVPRARFARRVREHGPEQSLAAWLREGG